MAREKNDLPILDLVLVDLTASGPGLLALEEREPRLAEADRQDFKAASNAKLAGRRRAGHIALRLLLEHFVGLNRVRGVAFHRAEHGQPSLPSIDPAAGTYSPWNRADTSAQNQGRTGSQLHFSISYSGDEALIALARNGPVGVDLERPRSIRLSPARRARIQAAAGALVAGSGSKVAAKAGNLEDGQRTLVSPTSVSATSVSETPVSAAALETGAMLAPDQAAFLQAWTRLEALAKATGLGVVRLFGRFDLLGPNKLWTPDHDAGVRDFLADARLALSDLSLGPDRFAALAMPRSTPADTRDELDKATAGLVREFPVDPQSLRAIAAGDLAPSDLPPKPPR